MKIKLHFNRVNMQRKKPEVWTAHTSRACEQSGLIVVRHNGHDILRTVFNKEGRQPRAYLQMFGKVRRNGRNIYIDVDDDPLAQVTA